MAIIKQIVIEPAEKRGTEDYRPATLWILTEGGDIAFVNEPSKFTQPKDWEWINVPDGVN